ncbi:MAG: sigma 54-interacting transcriptional regulator, partial [Wenzhouxiangellaceae bacterium]
GTLFLDEIGTLPMAQQAKLLRVLETGRFERVGENRTRAARVRLIAATNADLQAMVERDEFRRDLFFRLNTIELHIPPLAERMADVLPLAERFLDRFNRKYGRTIGFSDAARSALHAHLWPGNVRELAHAVERAVLLSAGDNIAPADLMLYTAPRAMPEPPEVRPLERIERDAVELALQRYDGDVNRAAEALGLSRSAMYRRLEKHGIRPGDTGG